MSDTDEIYYSNALTRYLYSVIEVRQSLFISLLNHDPTQALYWGYESYYSGFEKETFEFLQRIYNDIYAENNPDLKDYINELRETWDKNDDNRCDCNVGSIIYTLALRPYNLVTFVKDRLSYKITKDEQNEDLMPQCLISLTPEHIETYKTKIVDVEKGEKARNLLTTVKLYPIMKEYNTLFTLFNTKSDVEFKDIYNYPFEKWLYYASRSPIWLERITDHNGSINDYTKTVTFLDEDDENNFCELWDYEQNELPSDIHELSIGTGKEKQLTIRQFCKKYKYTVVSKITKRKVTKKSEKTG